MNIKDRQGRIEYKGFIFSWASEADHWGAESGTIAFMYSRKHGDGIKILESYKKKYKSEHHLDIGIWAHTEHFYIWANREAMNKENRDERD